MKKLLTPQDVVGLPNLENAFHNQLPNITREWEMLTKVVIERKFNFNSKSTVILNVESNSDWVTFHAILDDLKIYFLTSFRK